ncbi:amidohydrolase family protein [Streptomyces sp. NPDC054765]
MRIDAHHHLWDLDLRDQQWTRELPVLHRTYTMAGLRPSLERHALDGTVAVQTVPVAEETPELLALAAHDPHVLAIVGWTDLTDPAVSDSLARLRELPGASALAGIRHGVQDEPDPDWLDRPDARRGIAAVADAGLAYDLLVRPDQLPAAVRVVREMPEVRFVLDHAGNPLAGPRPEDRWTTLMAELGGYPNIAVKLSGLVTLTDGDPVTALRPYADTLLSTVGPQRLMYGSDWPVCRLAAEYDEVVAVAEALTEDLGADERAAVFGATAAHWYGIHG